MPRVLLIAFVLLNTSRYISELVDYLCGSFDTRHICFELDIAPIKLDVAQTVPMGLILNEAVTNAIKYAFREAARALFQLHCGIPVVIIFNLS